MTDIKLERMLFDLSLVQCYTLFDSAVMTDGDKVAQDSHFAMFRAITVKSLIIRDVPDIRQCRISGNTLNYPATSGIRQFQYVSVLLESFY